VATIREIGRTVISEVRKSEKSKTKRKKGRRIEIRMWSFPTAKPPPSNQKSQTIRREERVRRESVAVKQ